jgi:hypothetical protein
VRYDVNTPIMKITVIWDVTSCSLVSERETSKRLHGIFQETIVFILFIIDKTKVAGLIPDEVIGFYN